MKEDDQTITEALRRWNVEQPDALDRLIPLVYKELRKIAHAYLGKERTGHSLQTTGLVHEVYLRLVDQRKVDWASRAQFFAFASKLMRRILVDHARARQAAKRGQSAPHGSLDEALSHTENLQVAPEALLALDRSLEKLAKHDQRLCDVVVMRYFAGMNNDEIAEVLQISRATIKRDWRMARRFLARELEADNT